MSFQRLVIAEGCKLHIFFSCAKEKVFCSARVYPREFGFRILYTEKEFGTSEFLNNSASSFGLQALFLILDILWCL